MTDKIYERLNRYSTSYKPLSQQKLDKLCSDKIVEQATPEEIEYAIAVRDMAREIRHLRFKTENL